MRNRPGKPRFTRENRPGKPRFTWNTIIIKPMMTPSRDTSVVFLSVIVSVIYENIDSTEKSET